MGSFDCFAQRQDWVTANMALGFGVLRQQLRQDRWFLSALHIDWAALGPIRNARELVRGDGYESDSIETS